MQGAARVLGQDGGSQNTGFKQGEQETKSEELVVSDNGRLFNVTVVFELIP